MPSLIEEIQKIKNDHIALKKEVDRLTEMLRNVKGQPIFQGYAGKKLDLNENLNVVNLFKYIDSWTIKVNQQVSFRFRATNEPRLYIEGTIDGGTTWNEMSSFPS